MALAKEAKIKAHFAVKFTDHVGRGPGARIAGFLKAHGLFEIEEL
jgi:hypothetical protein